MINIPFFYHKITSSDLWWHMSCGRMLLTGGGLDWHKMYYSPIVDSYTNVMYTWLGDCILFFVYHILGLTGLQVLRGILILTMCYYLWLLSDRKFTLFTILIFTGVITGTHQLHILRNSIIGLAFLPMCIYYSINKKLWKLIITLILWSQIHGSVLFGVVISSILLLEKMNWKIFCGFLVLLFGLKFIGLNLFSYAHWPEHWRFLFGNVQEGSWDFLSPFSVTGRIYVKIGFLLSLFTLFYIKKCTLIKGVLYGFTLYLAVCYVRMVGYHCIICGYMVLSEESPGAHTPHSVYLGA